MIFIHILKFIKIAIGLNKLIKFLYVDIMETILSFKIALKYSKSLWRRIEIKSNQTLGELDNFIREIFNYDPWDHLSMFFSGRAWKSEEFGQIEPGGNSDGAKMQINQLELSEGDKLEYVYDFGDDIQHIITLEKIEERKINYQTPCIIAKSKSRMKYCNQCKSKGKKVKANWECLECLETNGDHIYLCDDCCEGDHEEHYTKEIV